MPEDLQARVLQSNDHWKRLLLRMEKEPTRKTLRQIAFALYERFERRRPDELDIVCDSLKELVRYFESKSDSPFSSEVCMNESPASMIARQHATQAFLVIGVFSDLALHVHSDARRQAGMKLVAKLLNSSTTKEVLHEIAKNENMSNNQLSERLRVSDSRISQILSPLKNLGLIVFRKSGTTHVNSLTELGYEEVEKFSGFDYRTRGNSDFAHYGKAFDDATKKGMGVQEAISKILEMVPIGSGSD